MYYSSDGTLLLLCLPLLVQSTLPMGLHEDPSIRDDEAVKMKKGKLFCPGVSAQSLLHNSKRNCGTKNSAVESQ